MSNPDKPPIVDYGTTGAPTTPLPRWFKACISIAIIVPVLFSAHNCLDKMRRQSGSTPDGNNLKRLGQAIYLYASEHNGNFPDSVAGMLGYGMPTSAFVCPDTRDTPAKVGPTTQATAANIMSGGHMSYVYVGKGFTKAMARSDVVVMYEPLSNHATCTDVLFGDGHCELVQGASATWMLKEINSGHNPPRPEPPTTNP